jgi:hypothetical protein
MAMLNNQMVGDWDRKLLHRIYRTKHQVRIMNHAKWSTMMNQGMSMAFPKKDPLFIVHYFSTS